MHNITRQGFLRAGGAFAFAPFAGTLFAADEKPLFRMGVMTDTHVGTTLESCSRVKAALELFRAKGVDMVVNNGDIADHFYPSGYRALRQIYNSTFPDAAARPREVWVYAWHDAFEFKKGVPRGDTVKYADEAFAEVRRLLEASDPLTTSFMFRGIPMIVFQQFDKPETIDRMVAEAVAANPGKPIFVFSHVPAAGTVYNSWNWGDMLQRKIYEKYPQVVDFSGHVHGSLRNDLFIWQKDFTVINSGCLQFWGGVPVNDDASEIKHEYGVLTADVFPSRLLVRRYDVRDGSEIDPEHPWNVALPFSSATAEYTPERKKARAAVPGYPEGAGLSAKVDANGAVVLAFPEVAGAVRAFVHRAKIERRDAEGRWTRYALRETFGDFHLARAESERKIVFQSGYFTPGERVRFTVHPLNAYGVAGKALATELDIPAHGGFKTVFDVQGLPAGFGFLQCSKNSECPPDAEGFYAPKTSTWSEVAMTMPEGAFAGPEKTRFRLVCDMDIRQEDDGSMWELVLKDAKTGASRTHMIHTCPGAPGVLRYVFEFTQPANASGSCNLSFRRGAGSRVRFVRVRLDRTA